MIAIVEEREEEAVLALVKRKFKNAKTLVRFCKHCNYKLAFLCTFRVPPLYISSSYSEYHLQFDYWCANCHTETVVTQFRVGQTYSTLKNKWIKVFAQQVVV